MELKVKIEDLKKLGITLTQYLYMWSLYNQIPVKFLDIKEEGIIRLEHSGHIIKVSGDYHLTPEGIDIFEPEEGSFSAFIEIFPTRVVDNAGAVRVLSPASPSSLVGQKLRKKWYNVTKRKSDLEDHVLQCLKREVEMRKKEGSLYWMRNAETWLNKATWEDYEYLLEQPKEREKTGKINEIKL